MQNLDVQQPRIDGRAAFRAWGDSQPGGRWERQDGLVIAMAPERLVHARIKFRACVALEDAIRVAGVPCEAIIDGPAVEIDDRTDYQPDVTVACGERGGDSELAISNPCIVVEVLSPSTSYRDVGVKLDGYFSLPSVEHYLLVWTDMRRVVQHSRLEPGRLSTRIHVDGPIDLSPPGLRIAVEDFYRGTELVG